MIAPSLLGRLRRVNAGSERVSIKKQELLIGRIYNCEIETCSPPGLLIPTLVTLPSMSLTRDLPIRSVGFPPTNAVHPPTSHHGVFISFAPLKLVCYPRSLAPALVRYVDHSHCLVLAPATLAALPSTRAISQPPCSMSRVRRAPFNLLSI